ncbi:MAG TPA: hypothetical protein VK533_13275 [Sphingomonas sp.]|uniref:hypothetical protein n=1 Tax=Sphingomonas sp. TaxID=28214 RepID=UPI002C9743CD|nr:hypothetical protein [Sphingomonas sp.]HMI20503.1 hypothetical protein [Sphingomonas sp.]
MSDPVAKPAKSEGGTDKAWPLLIMVVGGGIVLTMVIPDGIGLTSVIPLMTATIPAIVSGWARQRPT